MYTNPGSHTICSRAFALTLLTLFGTVSQLPAATLADLLAGGSITCGNTTFQNFHAFSSASSGGADGPTAAQIFVTPDTANCSSTSPGPGVLIQSAAWNVNAGQTIDTAFSFDVLAPFPIIGDAHLGLLSFAGDNGGQIHITESLFDNQNNNVANLLVDSLGGPITDSHVFGPGVAYSFLTVNKDISLEGHLSGNASLSTLTQNFSQVPEPLTMGLTGAALIGLTLWRRRHTA